MIHRTVIGGTQVIFPSAWKPLLTMSLFFTLLGFIIIVFARVVIFIFAALAFTAAFISLRAALRSWLNSRNRHPDVIEID